MIGDIFQPTHLLFVLIIALLVLGPKRLPEVARSLGRGIRDFKTAINTEPVEHQEELASPAHDPHVVPEQEQHTTSGPRT